MVSKDQVCCIRGRNTATVNILDDVVHCFKQKANVIKIPAINLRTAFDFVSNMGCCCYMLLKHHLDLV